MSLISLGIPTYDGSEEADFELFVNHYLGHLGAVNVNPFDLAANPSGASRAMGILRGSLQGRAAEFFDRELAGKRWEIQYIHKNGNIANLAGLQLLVVPEGALGPNANTYVNPSPARTYSLDAGNALHTIGQAFIPTGLRFMDNEAWARSGGRPTNAPANEPRNDLAGAGNGQPIVLNQITPDMALYWMSTRLPALLEEKRRMKFGNLTQGNLPIRDYYYKVDRASRLLNFPQEVRDNQFFRGLSSENVIEAERAGIGRPVSELVDIIERIEMRKDETRSGLYDRRDEHTRHRKIVEPVERPPVSSQEPITIKPVTSHAITQDMLNNLLQQHTKNITENLTNNFQTQIRALQEQKATQRTARVPPPVPPKDYEQMHRFYEGNAPNPFDDNREYSFEEIMGADYKAPPKVIKIAQRVAKKLAQAEERRQDRELARAMQGLNMDDHYPEPMDTSNLVRIGDTEVDADDLNVYIANLIRSQKKR